MVAGKAFFRVLRKFLQPHPGREPKRTPGPFSVDTAQLASASHDKLRMVWLGHSTVLIEADGKRFLTDPVWYKRASPFTALGPKRFFPNPLPLFPSPKIDAILLSHDHYDHLDKHTVLALAKHDIPIITLLGVGKRLVNWGVSKSLVTELDWWQTHEPFPGFSVTATPARHFSGRSLADRFTTLWGAFALKTPKHNIFFGADSGYYNGFKAIGERLGPFELAMLEIGAYNEEWESIHMGPENAVQATIDLGKPTLLPIHWGTFNLALHTWKEPVERLLVEAGKKGVDLILPAPGEIMDVNGQPYNSRWWEAFR